MENGEDSSNVERDKIIKGFLETMVNTGLIDNPDPIEAGIFWSGIMDDFCHKEFGMSYLDYKKEYYKYN